ncbi:MAG: hypothetical protein KKD12_07745 [Proteobacteria bacterium]|nr:hypothetical protein [Desulfobacteraceae bacterium]MBU4209544.1 hypothetical protein [Pseudomonadota bacterium]
MANDEQRTAPTKGQSRRVRKRDREVVTAQVHGSMVHGSRLENDEEYISLNEFKDVYEQAGRIPRGGTAVRGFINYLKKYEKRKATNPEP